MKKSIFTFVLILGVTFYSCDNQQSLQEYYVEKQQTNEFISFDLPASIIQLNEDAGEESKEAMASLKKFNLLAFKTDESNKEMYSIEKEKVKTILKNKKYQELIRVKHENANIMVKYLGSEEEIDELIVFASDNQKGFAIARVIGDHMKPEQMIKLINNINKVDKDNPAFSQIKGLFGSK
ncbi:MAG: DUF4252 domain-containing protein [Bacteroidota bacterium]